MTQMGCVTIVLLKKSVLVNNLIKYDELRISCVMLCRSIVLIPCYPWYFGIQFLCRLEMGTLTIYNYQLPPLNTIEMYFQTRPRDHLSGLSSSFDQEIMGHDVEIHREAFNCNFNWYSKVDVPLWEMTHLIWRRESFWYNLCIKVYHRDQLKWIATWFARFLNFQFLIFFPSY